MSIAHLSTYSLFPFLSKKAYIYFHRIIKLNLANVCSDLLVGFKDPGKLWISNLPFLLLKSTPLLRLHSERYNAFNLENEGGETPRVPTWLKSQLRFLSQCTVVTPHPPCTYCSIYNSESCFLFYSNCQSSSLFSSLTAFAFLIVGKSIPYNFKNSLHGIAFLKIQQMEKKSKTIYSSSYI